MPMSRSDIDPAEDGERPEIVHWFPPRGHPHARLVDRDVMAVAMLALGALVLGILVGRLRGRREA
jgi:hypothetical protein